MAADFLATGRDSIVTNSNENVCECGAIHRAAPRGRWIMSLHFFAEFPSGCDSKAVDAALKPMDGVLDVLWVPKTKESEPDAIAISVHSRRDPLTIVEHLIALFDVLEGKFQAVIFEMQTGRRYGHNRFRHPVN
jgi:hypothetical protein